jgi:hypothetical protein
MMSYGILTHLSYEPDLDFDEYPHLRLPMIEGQPKWDPGFREYLIGDTIQWLIKAVSPMQFWVPSLLNIHRARDR